MGFEWVPVGGRPEAPQGQRRTVLSDSIALDSLVLAARLDVPDEPIRARDHGRHARTGGRNSPGGHRRQPDNDIWRRYLHFK
jgi:hypothetical protein